MHLVPLDPSTATAASALQCRVDAKLLGAPESDRGAVIVDPCKLDPAAREHLFEELFATTGSQHSEGALRRFKAELMPASVTRSRLAVYRDEAGFALGCLAFHEQDVEVEGRSAVVLRGAAHLPVHLRDAEAGAFFLGRAVQALLRAGGRPLYIVQALVDPAAYAWLYRVADRVWPCPARQTPPEIDALRSALLPQLGLGEAVGSPELRKVGTALSASAARRWRRHPRPEVHYFVGRNPGFDRGHGLLTVVPLRAGGLLRAYLRSGLESAFGGLFRRLQRRRRRASLSSSSGEGRQSVDRRR